MAQPSPQDVVEVSFKDSRGGHLPGWEMGDKSLPAVLLIQEWWGITPIVKMQASLIASRGYRVMVPDLYTHTKLYQETGRTTAFDKEEACHSFNTLDFKLATDEIGSAARYLKATGSPCVAVVGGCMGGALAFGAAEMVPELCCAVAFYGTLEPFLWKNESENEFDEPYFHAERIRIPMQYHTGELDNCRGFADVRTGRAVVNRMKRAGCDVEFFVYADTPHSFLNALVPGGAEFLAKWDYGVPPHDMVQLAFERTIAFFDKHCKS